MKNASKKVNKAVIIKQLQNEVIAAKHLLKQTAIIAAHYRTGSTPEEIIKTMFAGEVPPETEPYKKLIEEMIKDIETEAEAIRKHKEQEIKKVKILSENNIAGQRKTLKTNEKLTTPETTGETKSKRTGKPRAKAKTE